MKDSLSPASWQGMLTTRALGRGECRYMDCTDSTNIQLRQMARRGAPHGSLCMAETQTAGKGRLGRSWESPEGKGLWLSVLLRPQLKPEQAPLATLCAAMAMAQAVQEAAGLDAKIKWPNDLVYDGRKLCGILLEMSATAEKLEYIVVGTGLNVHEGAYSPELRGKAAAIAEFTRPPERRALLVRYLAALEDMVVRLESEGFDGIAAEYAAHSCTIGSEVNVVDALDPTGKPWLSGRAEGIDENGALLVRKADGDIHRVLAGDVSVRGVMGYV